MVLQFAVGGAVIPFVSLLLRDRGLDYSQISVIFLASSSTLLVFPFLWGMLADRILPINRLFTVLNLAAATALGLLAGHRTFIGMLLSFTFFYACFNPTLTLINALSFHHLNEPRRQFGRLRSWGSLGWILPSLPTFLWLARAPGADLEMVLFLGVGLCLAMAVMTLFLPHTPPGSKPITPDLKRLGYWPAMKRLLADMNYLTVLLSFFLMAASFGIMTYYSPPFLEDLGVGRAWLGPIQCIGVVVEIIFFRWLPSFMARWRPSATIAIGCSALLVRHLLFAFVDNPAVLCASYLLAGLVIVFYHIGISILVNSIARLEVRATAQTLLVFFGSGMGPMFGNWVVTLLAGGGHDGLKPVFLFAASLAGLAGGLILVRGARLNEAGAATSPVLVEAS